MCGYSSESGLAELAVAEAIVIGVGTLIDKRVRELLMLRAGAGGSDRTCDHRCLERREIAGVGAEHTHLEDSITAHLEQGQMFRVRELRR